MKSIRKIINDPVYGFITIDDPLIFQVISHPYYQRLRRIHQMAFAELVYPGAVHSRLHHSLGAFHLMGLALSELKRKGIDITPEEEQGAKVAILLHDIGHGPYSHALENVLIRNVSHEKISIEIIQELNKTFDNKLSIALEIFEGKYHKPFLSQLISGQIDVDRMDYLSRDSYFTGVSEGVIGYDRILKMLTVHDGKLMVENKAIYSIEKFLVARRLMYWQVYLHKTVLSAEQMLIRIVERSRELIANKEGLSSCSPVFDFFLKDNQVSIRNNLSIFCELDDYDVLSTIKNWMTYPDKVLSTLCSMLVQRKLLKVEFFPEKPDNSQIENKRKNVAALLNITEEDARYFVFGGEAVNTTYNPADERINILFRDGSVKDISKVDNALIHQTLSSPVKKFYICSLGVK
ncbi:MAG TPA: HD domain-containing protein [Chitinophagaceae bacterium]|nr:HD domain-containing protein [Chitinophagaceae bacterium]